VPAYVGAAARNVKRKGSKHNLHARNACKMGINPAKVKDERSRCVVSGDRGDRTLVIHGHGRPG
jgi:hypothetical protein